MLASIKSAIAAANAATLPIQQAVVHEAWIGQDKNTKPIYAAPVGRLALVQEGALPHRTRDGEVITTKAKIGFLYAVPVNGTANRHEPIDPRDRFTLPSGQVGTVIAAQGVMVDPATSRPVASSVWLV